jgi:sulfur carrier protein
MAGAKEKRMITVHLEPDGEVIELHGIKTVLAVLNRLNLRATMAIVARDGELLTADRRLSPNDTILVRKVTSAG